MSANVSTIKINRPPVRVKSIALPTEHGSWGLVFEPLVAATAVAASIGSVWVILMVTGAFLARQPLKVLLNDWLMKRRLPQTEIAFKFTLFYGAISAVGLIGSLYFIKVDAFLPFAAMIPFAAYQIYCDAQRKSRDLLPELTGALAISSSAAVIALAAGWTMPNALALWAIFSARLIPSILYVRARLRLEKGKDFSPASVVLSNTATFVAVAALAYNALIPALPVGIFAVLTLRAVIGISPYRRKIKAMRIGVWEVIYGALTVLAIILGYLLHI